MWRMSGASSTRWKSSKTSAVGSGGRSPSSRRKVSSTVSRWAARSMRSLAAARSVGGAEARHMDADRGHEVGDEADPVAIASIEPEPERPDPGPPREVGEQGRLAVARLGDHEDRSGVDLDASHSSRRSRASVWSRSGGAWTLLIWIGYSGIAPSRPLESRIGATIGGRPGPTSMGGLRCARPESSGAVDGDGGLGRANDREPPAGVSTSESTLSRSSSGVASVDDRRLEGMVPMVARGAHRSVTSGGAVIRRVFRAWPLAFSDRGILKLCLMRAPGALEAGIKRDEAEITRWVAPAAPDSCSAAGPRVLSARGEEAITRGKVI